MESFERLSLSEFQSLFLKIIESKVKYKSPADVLKE